MQTLDKPVGRSLNDPLIIAGRTFHSRLMTGTGKYRNFDEMRQSVAASGCEIVTVAVRRVQTNAPGHEGLAEALDWTKIWMLPNTAGCKTAEDAIRVARLGREMAKLLGQEDNNFVKLEVIPDSKYLLPDPRSGRAIGQGRVCSTALHQCRSPVSETVRGSGLCHSHASGFSDWVWARLKEYSQYPNHY